MPKVKLEIAKKCHFDYLFKTVVASELHFFSSELK
jgi:hypothetical protein